MHCPFHVGLALWADAFSGCPLISIPNRDSVYRSRKVGVVMVESIETWEFAEADPGWLGL